MRPSRLAPLSFAVCLAMSGAAFAAPTTVAPTHESAAGPGFFKRTATKIGGALKSLAVHIVNAKDDAVAHLSAKLAAHVQRTAAQKDMNKWLKQSDNGDLKAFHIRANNEAGVGDAKLARAVNMFNGVGGLAIAPLHPLLGPVITGYSVSQAHDLREDVRARSRIANTRTVLHAIATSTGEDLRVNMRRADSWAKAGLVDRDVIDAALNKAKASIEAPAAKPAAKLVGRDARGRFTKLTEDAPVAKPVEMEATKEATKPAAKLVGRDAKGRFTKIVAPKAKSTDDERAPQLGRELRIGPPPAMHIEQASWSPSTNNLTPPPGMDINQADSSRSKDNVIDPPGLRTHKTNSSHLNGDLMPGPDHGLHHLGQLGLGM
jgi:hypothetical protein